MAGRQDELSALGICGELAKYVEIRRDDPPAVPRTNAFKEKLDQRSMVEPVKGQAHYRRGPMCRRRLGRGRRPITTAVGLGRRRRDRGKF